MPKPHQPNERLWSLLDATWHQSRHHGNHMLHARSAEEDGAALCNPRMTSLDDSSWSDEEAAKAGFLLCRRCLTLSDTAVMVAAGPSERDAMGLLRVEAGPQPGQCEWCPHWIPAPHRKNIVHCSAACRKAHKTWLKSKEAKNV